jgi:hypothetical protein
MDVSGQERVRWSPARSVGAPVDLGSLCVPRGIRTPNRQIRSLVLYVHAISLSAVCAAQVRGRIQPALDNPPSNGWWTATRTATDLNAVANGPGVPAAIAIWPRLESPGRGEDGSPHVGAPRCSQRVEVAGVANEDVQREVLPIPDRRYPGLITYDARDPDSSFAPIAPVRPPEGAPNVLLVLLDDVGFGAGSASGGPCEMPTAERVAGQGLKYMRFHTTALCSPTRAALITGRNHHSVGMGHLRDGCSASIWSAPDGSGLLRLDASSVQTDTEGSSG